MHLYHPNSIIFKVSLVSSIPAPISPTSAPDIVITLSVNTSESYLEKIRVFLTHIHDTTIIPLKTLSISDYQTSGDPTVCILLNASPRYYLICPHPCRPPSLELPVNWCSDLKT